MSSSYILSHRNSLHSHLQTILSRCMSSWVLIAIKADCKVLGGLQAPSTKLRKLYWHCRAPYYYIAYEVHVENINKSQIGNASKSIQNADCLVQFACKIFLIVADNQFHMCKLWSLWNLWKIRNYCNENLIVSYVLRNSIIKKYSGFVYF